VKDYTDTIDDLWLLLGFGLVLYVGIYLVNHRHLISVLTLQATTPPAPVPARAPVGGGGGGTQPAFNIPTCPAGISCSTETSGGTRRECQNIGSYADLEATWCGTVSSGRELAFKFWGPYHTDQNCPGRGGSAADCVGSASCCWCIMAVCTATGQFYMRSEGPHPDYNGNTCSGIPGSAGRNAKPLSQHQCLKAVSRKTATGINIKGYAFEAGKWVEKLNWSGPSCGSSYVLTSPVAHADFVFRLNGPHQTTCATVRPLGPKVTPGHPQRSGGGGGAA
jgi:hypothetical protein